MLPSIISSSSTRILVPQFYIGIVSQYDDVGVGDVKLVYSSRFEGVESTGWVGDIIASDDEVSFLESQIMGAVRFFEDTLGTFGKQGYVLFNGATFQVGYAGILPIPSFLEERIKNELSDIAQVDLIQASSYELREMAQLKIAFRQVFSKGRLLQ